MEDYRPHPAKRLTAIHRRAPTAILRTSPNRDKEKNMKGIHCSVSGLVATMIVLLIALPCYGEAPRKTLADECQYAMTAVDRSTIFTMVPLTIRDGYTVEVFTPKVRRKATKNIAVILHNRSDSPTPEVPRIVAVCLDGKKDLSSINGNISFSNEKKGRTKILFRLVDFTDTTWVTPPEKAVGIVPTEAPNSSDIPVQGVVPACLTPPAISIPNMRDLTFTMCPNNASYAYFYVYAVYTLQNGQVIPLDPQIIHHPPN
jgi:hypothetical protein